MRTTKIKPIPTDSIKEALLAAHGSIVTIRGERRKLSATQVGNRFFADAEILNPSTAEDAKFPLMDLLLSESEMAMKFLAEFAILGGWVDKKQPHAA